MDDSPNFLNPNDNSDLVVWKLLVEAKLTPKNLIDQIFKSISLRSSSKNEMETSFSL